MEREQIVRQYELRILMRESSRYSLLLWLVPVLAIMMLMITIAGSVITFHRLIMIGLHSQRVFQLTQWAMIGMTLVVMMEVYQCYRVFFPLRRRWLIELNDVHRSIGVMNREHTQMQVSGPHMTESQRMSIEDDDDDSDNRTVVRDGSMLAREMNKISG
jgi:hypothetical protein